MARKTRKAKMRALEHKRLQFTRESMNVSEPKHVSISTQSKKSPHEDAPKTKSQFLESAVSPTKKYFMQDLRKSLILIVAIIGLEIVIYYGTINTYLASFFKF